MMNFFSWCPLIKKFNIYCLPDKTTTKKSTCPDVAKEEIPRSRPNLDPAGLDSSSPTAVSTGN